MVNEYIMKCSVCSLTGVDEGDRCPRCGWIASVLDDMLPDIVTGAGNTTTLNEAREKWNNKTGVNV